jgi:hypothetical protein
MDGKGSIQINKKKKKLLFRLIIKLDYTKANFDMLIIIAKVISGTVRIINQKKEVI